MRRETSGYMRAGGRAGAGAALGALLAGVAVGCAAAPDYGEYLIRWQGKNNAELRADWGKPDYRYRDHRGRETLQYIYREVIFESLSSGRRVVWWCLTNFHLGRDGRVAETSSTGNHCFPPANLAADRARRQRRGGVPADVPPAEGTY
jgi:hypothetical protein